MGKIGIWNRLSLAILIAMSCALNSKNLWAQGPVAQACVDVTDGLLQLNYRAVEILPSLQLNGSRFDTNEAQSVQIWLAQDGVLQVLLGETHLPSQPVNVVVGTYDLVYRDITPAPAPLLPVNTQAVFQHGVVIDTPGDFVANVQTASLSGSLTNNGVAFPVSAAETANIFAVGKEGQGEVFLYETKDQSFSQILIKGIYDIVYRHEIGGIVPMNQNAVVHTLDLQTSLPLNADVVSHDTTGDFYFNGIPAPASLAAHAEMEMRRTSAGGLEDIVQLGKTSDESYSRQIIAGRYGVYYQVLNGTTIVPGNTNSPVPGHSDIAVDGLTHDIDITKSTYAGEFTVNGVPAVTSVIENGEVVFIDQRTGAIAFIEETANQSFERVAIPGTYDLAYRIIQGNQFVPANEFKVFAQDVEFVYGGAIVVPMDIDIPMTDTTVLMTLGGSPWNPGSGNASIRLMEAEGNHKGDFSVLLGDTDGSPWQELLIPGKYRVLYQRETGSGIPINGLTHLSKLVTISGLADSVTINLPYIDLTPSATLNGSAWPTDQNATLSLLGGDGVAGLGSGAGAWPARRLLQGSYRVLYGFESGSTIPNNVAHQQPCVSAEFCLFCDSFESAMP